MMVKSRKLKKRILAITLTICMMAAICPLSGVAAGTPTNLALGKAALASSDMDPARASQLVDGIYHADSDQNFWTTKLNEDKNAWWQVDLGDVYLLSETKIQYRRVLIGEPESVYRFVPKAVTLQVSDNGTTWTTVVSKSGNVPEIYSKVAVTSPDLFTYSLNNASGRYLRLLFERGTSDLDANHIQLAEVEVYGEKRASLAAVSASRTSVTEATVKFSSDKAGAYFYQVVEDGAAIPEIDTTGAGTACTAGETTISLTALGAGAKDIYIKVKDGEGNVSSPLKMDIPLFANSPVLTAGSAARASNKEATVKFSSDKAGTYFYKVVTDGAAIPEIDTTGTGTVCAAGETTISLTALSAGAKDIYIKVKDAGGNASSALKMDIPFFATLLSRGKTASASSEFDNNRTAGRVVDGVYLADTDQNFWSTTENTDVGSWWKVDLGGVKDISDVKIQFRRVGINETTARYRFVPKTVTLQVSNDGSSWTTVIGKSANVPAIYKDLPKTTPDLFSYTLNTSGRYLRLLFEDGTSDLDAKHIQLAEVDVYGSVIGSSLNPQTGDNSSLWLWTSLLGSALLLAAAFTARRFTKRKKIAARFPLV